jgi:hypothetical protein
VKISRSAIGTILTLGVCGFAASASADTFNPHHPECITEFHGVNGANSSSSFAATAVMGELGFSCTPPPADWETFITSACTSQTKTIAPNTVWPAVCNPDGMALALNTFTGTNWVVFKFDSTQQTAALNELVTGLQTFFSPIPIPIYGQADHWVTVTQITATVLAPGSFSILQVKAFDGGPVGGTDSSFNTYNGGPQSWSGSVFKNVFFLVVTAINPSCDFVAGGCGAPPVSDPFYNKYVEMIEPPSGPHATVNADFVKSPGIVASGHMNEHLAQMRLWDALVAAGINNDPTIWNSISSGRPGPASLVNGLFPNGSPWDYFLVPIVSNANTVLAFVQLSAEDGSFQHIQTLTTPVPFAPVDGTRAGRLANSLLGRGEILTEGRLTWDPRSGSQFGRSPSFPYYEFGIRGANGTSSVARVNLLNGSTERSR